MPKISRKKRIVILALGLALFSALAHSTFRSLSAQKKVAEQSSGPYAKGAVLPESFSLENLEGKASALSDYDGKVVLINFWAGWCAPCIAEMPGLYDLRQRLHGKGFEVLAVNMDEDPADGMRTLRQRIGEAPFPVFKGAGTSLASRFGIEGLPFTVVVGKDRKIQYARPGEVNWRESDTVKLIEAIL
jgi:thiol-disulfide isomerase/thioredoxin